MNTQPKDITQLSDDSVPILRAENLTKQLSPYWHMKNFNLSLFKNQVLGVIGKSGTGKSVLMRLLFGFMQRDQGKIFVNEQEVVSNNVFQSIKDHLGYVGFVFQGSALFDSMTVEENIHFVLRTIQTPAKQYADITRKILSEVDLNYDNIRHLMSGNLSGGAKHRVALARALALNPALLILDEPTSGLDSITSKHIGTLLKNKIREQSITSITITHDLPLLSEIATHILLLDLGKIVWYGSIEDFWISDHPMIRDFINSVDIRKDIEKFKQA